MTHFNISVLNEDLSGDDEISFTSLGPNENTSDALDVTMETDVVTTDKDLESPCVVMETDSKAANSLEKENISQITNDAIAVNVTNDNVICNANVNNEVIIALVKMIGHRNINFNYYFAKTFRTKGNRWKKLLSHTRRSM